MTVTDIAHEIKINRNSVAKYLDVLLISGNAEMVTFGPAKVFFPSTRIPLSLMLNFTHDYIALLNKELQFMQVNENFLNVLGIHRDDIIRQPIDTFTSLFFQIPEIAQNSHLALDGKKLTVEKQYTENDHTSHYSIQHIPITFDDGEPGVAIIIEDITERKECETTARHAIQEWDIVFNLITDMVFILDAGGTIVRANKAFANFLHLSIEECIGKKCSRLIHGCDNTPASCPCAQMKLTKKPVTQRFYEPHLRVNLEAFTSPIISDDGEITSSVHVMKSIPDQKKEGTIE